MALRLGLTSAVALAFALSGCDPPSTHVDAGDLRGVFDAPSSSAASSAPKPKRSADVAAPEPTQREGERSCVTESGTPKKVDRVVGRPACRSAEVLEWRDPTGAPRYACLYGQNNIEARAPLPVVLFFHGAALGLDDPSSMSKLTNLRGKMGEADLSRDPKRPGFLILGVQGRALDDGEPGSAFDAEHASSQNLDVLAVDQFLDQIVTRKIADPKRVYAVGTGRGGEMAVAYTLLRADRVAAFAAFAPHPPSVKWSCDGPEPPGITLYRACDRVVPCEEIESWLLGRERAGAKNSSLRLGEDAKTEPNCTPKNACSPQKGEANHGRWPKSREADVLAFLGAHALK